MTPSAGGAYLADLLALQTLNANLAYVLNRRGGAEIGQFFTNEAVYKEGLYEIGGRVAIEAHFAEIVSRQNARYSFDVCQISILGDGSASGALIYIRYCQGQPGAPSISINDVDDVYELCADGIWRVASRKITVSF